MLIASEEQAMEVLLVDDHPIVRVGFASLLDQLDRRLIVHEADDGVQAIQVCLNQSPDVALVDLSLAGELSLDLIKKIHSLRPKMAILVVSMHDERLYAERALRAGARGYVMKHNAAKSIVQAVRTICDGHIWLSDAMRSIVLEKLTDRSDSGNSNSLESLSDRELEVFRLIGRGLKKSEISMQPNIAASTIETRRVNIKRKLGIASGSALYRLAFLHFQA